MIELKIDPEFRDKIPPLTEAEFAQLRENILADGEVREPLVIWNGVIVDGHNRWKIIQEHPEIPYRMKQMEFADKWAAFEWIYKNQLGRRNLTDEQRTSLIAKVAKSQMKTHGASDGFRGNQYTSVVSGQNDTIPRKNKNRTRDHVAAELGIGSRTVDRAIAFDNGLEEIRKIAPDAAEKVLQGKSNVTKATISSVPHMEPAEKEAVVEQIRNPMLSDTERRERGRSKAEKPKSLIQQIVADLKADKPAASDYDFTDDVSLYLRNTLRDTKNLLVEHSTELTDEKRKKIIAALVEAETAIVEMKGLVKS